MRTGQFRNYTNYIIHENGKVFSNITNKYLNS